MGHAGYIVGLEVDEFVGASALDLAASVEPNLLVDKPVRVSLSPEDKANIQRAADFMLEAKILKTPVDTATMIRNTSL